MAMEKKDLITTTKINKTFIVQSQSKVLTTCEVLPRTFKKEHQLD
jgi:hypothetical protein